MPLYGLSEAFSRLNSPYPLSLSRWPWLHQIKNLLKEINFLLSLISYQTEMCYLYYLVENKIVASFLNKSQFVLGLQWWDAQADASHASCMSLVRRSPTTFCCYNHANSRIPSLHLLKQLYGMGSAISAPHQSPAQGCKKLWMVPWTFGPTLPCHAESLWFKLNNLEMQKNFYLKTQPKQWK